MLVHERPARKEEADGPADLPRARPWKHSWKRLAEFSYALSWQERFSKAPEQQASVASQQISLEHEQVLGAVK